MQACDCAVPCCASEREELVRYGRVLVLAGIPHSAPANVCASPEPRYACQSTGYRQSLRSGAGLHSINLENGCAWHALVMALTRGYAVLSGSIARLLGLQSILGCLCFGLAWAAGHPS